MLKLIKNEFRKLKRKHFISFVFIAALLFPIPFTALVLSGNIANYSGFDAIFGLLVTLGEPVMLDCVITRIKNSMSACRNSPKASYNIYDCRII